MDDYGEKISYLTLPEGAEVISSDGEPVGKIEHILAEEGADIFDGIVIDIQFGPGGHRFVDAPQVADCRERAVILSIPKSEVERLPEPSENPAALEHHGAEDTESELEGKLRRAWDLISGKR